MRRLLDRHGDDYSGWRSRLLTRELLESVDLVLSATTRHRSEIAWLAPRALRTTYPLLQFAALCRHTPGGLPGLDAPVDLDRRLSAVRERLPFRRESPDLPDPVGRSFRVFERTDRAVSQAADEILGLAGSGPRT